MREPVFVLNRSHDEDDTKALLISHISHVILVEWFSLYCKLTYSYLVAHHVGTRIPIEHRLQIVVDMLRKYKDKLKIPSPRSQRQP
jgi:hypothetical protein